jgi:hypothetical protein
LGAHPLFFEERAGSRRPGDSLDLTVPDHDPVDDDAAQLLSTRRRCRGDGLWQIEDPRSVRVKDRDPIAFRQSGESGRTSSRCDWYSTSLMSPHACCFLSCSSRVASLAK